MKKLLFISKHKLDFTEPTIFVRYQDIIEGELLKLRTENKGLDITIAEEHVTITDTHLILAFWGDYRG